MNKYRKQNRAFKNSKFSHVFFTHIAATQQGGEEVRVSGDLGTAAKGRRRRGCTRGAASDGGRMRGRGADERSDEALISDRDNDPERKAISLSLSLSE
jgi:hypothetical protein